MLIKAFERNWKKRRVHDASDWTRLASQHRRAEESGSAEQWIPKLLHPRDIREPEAEDRRIGCKGLKRSSDNDEQEHASILGAETVYFGQAVLDCDERGWKASVFGSVCEESSWKSGVNNEWWNEWMIDKLYRLIFSIKYLYRDC